MDVVALVSRGQVHDLERRQRRKAHQLKLLRHDETDPMHFRSCGTNGGKNDLRQPRLNR
ncbi:hypothetical protein [Bradyrhizobium sp. LM6.9]